MGGCCKFFFDQSFILLYTYRIVRSHSTNCENGHFAEINSPKNDQTLHDTGVLKKTKILILVKSIHVKDVAKHPEEFTVESVYVRLYLWAAFSHRGARKKATTRSA